MRTSPSGIAGLDQILHGGFPTGRTTVVIGGAGCGKTVLAMQFLVNGWTKFGEPGLLVSFEESPASLATNFAEMSFPFAEAAGTGVLLLDGRVPVNTVEAGSFDLGGLIAVITALVAERGVKRIVIDAVDALFALSGEGFQRLEFLRLLEWLSEANLTALLTVKDFEGDFTIPGFFALAEYASDGVLQLRRRLIGELSRRTLSVLKMRGAGFEAGEHPYVISSEGIRVLHTPSSTTAVVSGLGVRLSTGVDRLDRMLMGGYRSGTTTLISGLPGTAKTTLGASFLEAGCRAGERCLFIGFDEPAEQMLVDVRSVGIDLEQFVRSGLLRAQSFAGGAVIADDHYLTIEALVDAHRPNRVVIDPITALEKSGGSDIAGVVAERIVALLKSRGISALFTAVTDTQHGELEATPLSVSTIADTWINLSFANQGGERNRTLTIVKSRGTGHSNQMREMVLSSDGVDLTDVYAAGGAVLLGTARAEREQQDAVQEAIAAVNLSHEFETLDRDREGLAMRLAEAQRGLDQIAVHRAELVKRTKVAGGAQARDAALIHVLRRGDPAE
jgi:circadian clock protein KaiC